MNLFDIQTIINFYLFRFFKEENSERFSSRYAAKVFPSEFRRDEGEK